VGAATLITEMQPRAFLAILALILFLVVFAEATALLIRWL
jgi:hypothetical protein